MQVFAKVRSTLSTAATTPTLPKHVAKPKDVAKNVAEILEDSGIESGRASSAAAHASMPEAVVQRSLLAIGKNCVSFRDLFELVFRVGIVRVAVRMVRHRQLAVSALDFDVGGGACDTKYLVKIAFCVGGQKLPHSSGSCFEGARLQPRRNSSKIDRGFSR